MKLLEDVCIVPVRFQKVANPVVSQPKRTLLLKQMILLDRLRRRELRRYLPLALFLHSSLNRRISGTYGLPQPQLGLLPSRLILALLQIRNQSSNRPIHLKSTLPLPRRQRPREFLPPQRHPMHLLWPVVDQLLRMSRPHPADMTTCLTRSLYAPQRVPN